MAIVRVQKSEGSSTGASVSVTWGSATGEGNFLVAVAGSFDTGTGSAGFPNIQPPAGWSTAIGVESGSGGTANAVKIFYKESANSEGSTGNFTADGNGGIAVVVAEYTSVATSGSLDQSASNTGSSSSPDSGTTDTTAQADEVAIAGFQSGDLMGGETFSSPTNSFAIVDQRSSGSSNNANVCMCELILSATQTVNCGVTYTLNQRWVGVVATFKEISASAGVPGHRLAFTPVNKQIAVTPLIPGKFRKLVS